MEASLMLLESNLSVLETMDDLSCRDQDGGLDEKEAQNIIRINRHVRETCDSVRAQLMDVLDERTSLVEELKRVEHGKKTIRSSIRKLSAALKKDSSLSGLLLLKYFPPP